MNNSYCYFVLVRFNIFAHIVIVRFNCRCKKNILLKIKITPAHHVIAHNYIRPSAQQSLVVGGSLNSLVKLRALRNTFHDGTFFSYAVPCPLSGSLNSFSYRLTNAIAIEKYEMALLGIKKTD